MEQATLFQIEKAWRIAFKDLGVDPSIVFKRAGLPEDLFSRENVLLGVDDYFNLWKALEAVTGDSLFAMTVGRMVTFDSFNPPLFAAYCSPNLNIGLTRLAKYKQLIGPMKLSLDHSAEGTTVTMDCLYTNKPLPESLLVMELVFITSLVRTGTREHVVPLSVETTSWLDNPEYEHFFGTRPIHGNYNRLRFSREDSERAFLTENSAMWGFFEPQLRRRLSEIEDGEPFTNRVRSCLFDLIPAGTCSVDDVALKLAVSRRTLQRRLGDENTTFQQELQSTREKLARHYLVNSELTGAQISFLLGFDDPNSFARAYRSWTGETPGMTRQAMA
jgi:AraC-like DNA-binding protein